MEKKTIGSFIAALRKAKGLTQRQLADMLNVSDKAVSRWERDETAPDLSLIPILADIFGVTSDEILRGQRSNPEEAGSKYEMKQTEKQVQYLLNRSKTSFQSLSVITVLVALCGLIAAMICNGFNRANLGFYISLVFYGTAAACQAIFLIETKANIQNNEIIDSAEPFIKDFIVLSEAVFTLIAGLFAATLPLLTYISDAYWGLSGWDWLVHGAAHGAVGIAIALLIIYILNCKFGYSQFPDLKTPRNKLRIRMLRTLCIVLVLTFAVHVFAHEYLNANPRLLTEGTRWDSWEELKEYLETPLDRNGEELTLVSDTLYMDSDGDYYHVFETSVLVYESDMETPKYEYIKRNFYVNHFSYSATESHLPIYTYTDSQIIQAEYKLAYINIGFCAFYLAEVIFSVLIYIKKSRKI